MTEPVQLHLTPAIYLSLLDNPAYRAGLWRNQAICLQVVADLPDLYNAMDWFPAESRGVPPHVKEVCQACPVRLECLVYALSTRQDKGIWAGRDQYTLKKIRRRLREALNAYLEV